MLEYNEIVERKFIILDGSPYEVMTSHVFRKQQRKPVNATKLKSLMTGKITERSFHQAEKVEEAEIITRDIKYLYTNKDEYWFSEPDDPSERFKLEASMVGAQGKFLKQNSIVKALVFNDKIIGLKLPIKVELKVIEAPPAVKGDTVTGGTKQIILETGAVINAPLFVNEGDVIRVNTETEEYAERV